jgi:hypothetical protein
VLGSPGAPAIVRRAVARIALLLAVLAAGAPLAGCNLGDEPSRPPQLGTESGDENAAVKLGFPTSATKNTVRVGGGDAATDAAGVANALYPAVSGSTRPTAVVLIDQRDWQAGITASVLAGSPIAAPLLVSDGDELPPVTKDTLERLEPRGSDLSRDAQVIRIGQEVARPDGYKLAVIEGKDPYERAGAIDRFFSAARGKPSKNVVVVSGERAEWAMPAAAWAARSGDAVLPVKRDSVPAPIQRALREHERPDVYVLGPEKVIGAKAVEALGKLGRVHRIAGPTPVENAIAFARYERRDFGWGVVVPGYNFTVANTSRPLDAAASAPLAAKGVYAPLLLTDRAGELPRALEAYFLSVQPGFEDDPGQAVYNRVWILGDDRTISLRQQARLDQITELVPVQANAP